MFNKAKRPYSTGVEADLGDVLRHQMTANTTLISP